MKNFVIVILTALLGIFAYLYFTGDKNDVTQNINNQESLETNDSLNINDGAIIIESDSSVPDTQIPATSTPASASSTVAFCQDLKDNVPGSASYVIMTGLAGGSTITNGDTLDGCVYAPNGSYAGWAPFEGQVGSYTVAASDGTILGQGPLSVVNTLDWMTDAIALSDIQYSTTMDFDATGYTSGTVTLQNENASGEPSMDKTVDITVTF